MAPRLQVWARSTVGKMLPNFGTSRMAAPPRAPDRKLGSRVLLWHTRGSVLPVNPGGVAAVHVAVVREEAVQPPHVDHVSDEHLYVRGGLRRLLHPVRPHQPRGSLPTNTIRKAVSPMDALLGAERSMSTASTGLPARDVVLHGNPASTQLQYSR